MIYKHNGIISFWKFAFCLMIIALHLGFYSHGEKYIFSAGSIAVDFFFIVSGYLLVKKTINYKFVKNDKIECFTKEFIIKRIKSFLPYLFFMWIFAIPFMIFIKKYNFTYLLNCVFNILYFPINNIAIDNILGISWYIVSLIIVNFLFFPILLKYNKKFIILFSPLIIYFLGSYISIKFGSLGGPWSSSIFAYKGILRAIFDMNIGFVIYLISEKMKNINYSIFSKILFLIIEIGGFLSIFYIVNLQNAHIRFDFIMLIIISICITLSFSEKTLFNDKFNNKINYFLEKLSLPMYINQFLIIELLEYIYRINNIFLNYYYRLLILIIVSIIVAYLFIIIIDFLKKKNYFNIRNLFIIK